MPYKNYQSNHKNRELQEIKEDLEILNDINRLRILRLIKERKEICVCKIYDALNLPQNLVSYHLGKLKKSGFVSSRKEGVNVIYRHGKKKINSFINKTKFF